jgi:hypothetical protein
VEQVKKELFEASLFAVALAAGLATISYALFAETPLMNKLEPVLDVYTPKGGIGINVTGGAFEPGDSIPVYAYLTYGSVRVNSSQVTFTIERPNGTETVMTERTNDSGVAEIPLSFLPSEGHVIGTWQILANASVKDQGAEDTMTLQCKSENARIDVFCKKNGAVSISFLPGDEVFLEARTSYKNAPIADAPVTFEVKTPNDTDFILPARMTFLTDRLGTANLTFQIPWPSNFSLGPWHATVTSQIYEQNVNATTEFDCKLVPPVIDVYTQKGGWGQNMPGGTYKLNESVVLYAEIRDALNHTVPNNLVAFEFQFSNKTSVPWNEVLFVQETNASGIANEIIRIPPVPEYAGTWAVYVSTRYNDTLLIDTLTFIAEP